MNQFTEQASDDDVTRRRGWTLRSINDDTDGPMEVTTGICEVAESNFSMESSRQPAHSSKSTARTTTSGCKWRISEYAPSIESITKISWSPSLNNVSRPW